MGDLATRIVALEGRMTAMEIAQARIEGALAIIKWAVPIGTSVLTAAAVLLVNYATRHP